MKEAEAAAASQAQADAAAPSDMVVATAAAPLGQAVAAASSEEAVREPAAPMQHDALDDALAAAAAATAGDGGGARVPTGAAGCGCRGADSRAAASAWLGPQAFNFASAFNANIGAWNTASMTSMSYVCALNAIASVCGVCASRLLVCFAHFSSIMCHAR